LCLTTLCTLSGEVFSMNNLENSDTRIIEEKNPSMIITENMNQNDNNHNMMQNNSININQINNNKNIIINEDNAHNEQIVEYNSMSNTNIYNNYKNQSEILELKQGIINKQIELSKKMEELRNQIGNNDFEQFKKFDDEVTKFIKQEVPLDNEEYNEYNEFQIKSEIFKEQVSGIEAFLQDLNNYIEEQNKKLKVDGYLKNISVITLSDEVTKIKNYRQKLKEFYNLFNVQNYKKQGSAIQGVYDTIYDSNNEFSKNDALIKEYTKKMHELEGLKQSIDSGVNELIEKRDAILGEKQKFIMQNAEQNLQEQNKNMLISGQQSLQNVIDQSNGMFIPNPKHQGQNDLLILNLELIKKLAIEDYEKELAEEQYKQQEIQQDLIESENELEELLKNKKKNETYKNNFFVYANSVAPHINDMWRFLQIRDDIKVKISSAYQNKSAFQRLSNIYLNASKEMKKMSEQNINDLSSKKNVSVYSAIPNQMEKKILNYKNYNINPIPENNNDNECFNNKEEYGDNNINNNFDKNEEEGPQNNEEEEVEEVEYGDCGEEQGEQYENENNEGEMNNEYEDHKEVIKEIKG